MFNVIKTHFEASAKDLFFSRNDPQDPRLGEIFKPLRWEKQEDLSQPNLVLLGWPDDEGIQNNGGRKGANLGPDTIRKYLYRMTPSYKPEERLFDAGNLQVAKMSLQDRHQIAQDSTLELLTHGSRVITLGGGHDYGYPDSAAFARWCQSRGHKPLVINFDAHLDVRPTDRGINSGTPFFRLLSEFSDVDFLEVGLQRQCNSVAHEDWLRDQGGRMIYIDDLEASGTGLSELVFSEISDWLIRPRPAFISVDIDAFSSANAPGCSQSWATGLTPREFFTTFSLLLTRLDVRGLGIYEVSPPLDIDDRTSKLAGLIAHRMLFPTQ